MSSTTTIIKAEFTKSGKGVILHVDDSSILDQMRKQLLKNSDTENFQFGKKGDKRIACAISHMNLFTLLATKLGFTMTIATTTEQEPRSKHLADDTEEPKHKKHKVEVVEKKVVEKKVETKEKKKPKKKETKEEKKPKVEVKKETKKKETKEEKKPKVEVKKETKEEKKPKVEETKEEKKKETTKKEEKKKPMINVWMFVNTSVRGWVKTASRIALCEVLHPLSECDMVPRKYFDMNGKGLSPFGYWMAEVQDMATELYSLDVFHQQNKSDLDLNDFNTYIEESGGTSNGVIQSIEPKLDEFNESEYTSDNDDSEDDDDDDDEDRERPTPIIKKRPNRNHHWRLWKISFPLENKKEVATLLSELNEHRNNKANEDDTSRGYGELTMEDISNKAEFINGRIFYASSSSSIDIAIALSA